MQFALMVATLPLYPILGFTVLWRPLFPILVLIACLLLAWTYYANTKTTSAERWLSETMLMLAPDLADLWREAGLLNARLGNMRASVGALEEFILRAPEGNARHQAAAMLQQLKSKLN